MRLAERATLAGNDARAERIRRTMERYYGNVRTINQRTGRAGYFARREYMGLANG